MKKLLTITLSIVLLLSATACGTNSELEALKQENEQLNKKLQILNHTPTTLTNLPPVITKYRVTFQSANMML